DVGDDHAVQRRADPFGALDLQPDHGQPVLQRLAVRVDGDVLAQPVFGEFHRLSVSILVIPGAARNPLFSRPTKSGSLAALGMTSITQTASGTARRSRRTHAGR